MLVTVNCKTLSTKCTLAYIYSDKGNPLVRLERMIYHNSEMSSYTYYDLYLTLEAVTFEFMSCHSFKHWK